MNLWQAYTCNMKSSGKCKNGTKVNLICIVDQDHQRSVVVIDYSRKLKGI